MRSTAALHEDAKPSNATAAHNSHSARSSVLAVSTIAARPRSFMIARVLLPLAAASRDKRDIGPLDDPVKGFIAKGELSGVAGGTNSMQILQAVRR